MKKLFALLISALMLFSLVSCGFEYDSVSSYKQSSTATTSSQFLYVSSSEEASSTIQTDADEISSESSAVYESSSSKETITTSSKASETSSKTSNIKLPNKNPSSSITSSDKTSSKSQSTIVTVPEKEETVGDLVWVPVNGGTKYHKKSTCSKMKDPLQVSVETAVKNGYTPCKRCYK